MNIVISGGTGLIGTTLAEVLFSSGHQANAVGLVQRLPQSLHDGLPSFRVVAYLPVDIHIEGILQVGQALFIHIGDQRLLFQRHARQDVGYDPIDLSGLVSGLVHDLIQALGNKFLAAIGSGSPSDGR